ncbi:hypothetical protein HAL013_16230 [Helicobacter ailurogastricus]|uniref:Uncharacterized protein n=1 Tax=Helicobacter ailurogastricus TaxID=1578720 RepID=A0A0K2X6T5_9HELI|nr:hypothetical protein HAL011_01710 [Helicobacter ailurogastricus]CRF43386.1 hypothetical protein HAL013_16230 [Helicobacter ailurogastricus]CRF43939.1 hypothetical protein HAL09_05030 [Helicobacter ailurogastricus]
MNKLCNREGFACGRIAYTQENPNPNLQHTPNNCPLSLSQNRNPLVTFRVGVKNT